MSASIAKTGFLVSIISYLIFFLFDLMRPGFVSRYFSIHLFLLAAVIFGICWVLQMKESKERAWLQYLTSIILGIIFSVMVWKAGGSLDEYHLLIIVIEFFVPLLILSVLRKT